MLHGTVLQFWSMGHGSSDTTVIIFWSSTDYASYLLDLSRGPYVADGTCCLIVYGH